MMLFSPGANCISDECLIEQSMSNEYLGDSRYNRFTCEDGSWCSSTKEDSQVSGYYANYHVKQYDNFLVGYFGNPNNKNYFIINMTKDKLDVALPQQTLVFDLSSKL